MKKKLFPKGMLLDVGCRDRKQPNFIGIDREIHPGVDIVHDLEKFPYPIKSNSCLTIKAAHIIEHIKPWLVIDFMNELWRMLILDGQLAISSPYAGSTGYLQDPTHCTGITEKTWQYFDSDYPAYQQYKPNPWKIEHSVYKPDGNIEAILRKRLGDTTVELTNKAMSFGAIQKPTELNALLTYLKDEFLKIVVEIGTSRGGVFYTLCQMSQARAVIVSIDLPGGEFGGEYTFLDEQLLRTFGKTKQELHFLRKDSHLKSTKKELLKILGSRKIDLLLIDGDHTYEGVKKDWLMYSSLVKNGGIIVFHDICFHPKIPDCQVEKFWKEIKPLYQVTEFIDSSDMTWGGIGILTYEEPSQKTK